MSQMAAPFLLLLVAMASSVGGLNILTSGNTLAVGQHLNNSLYFLAMQQDCNVVTYSGTPATPGHAVWSTTTGGDGQNCSLWMQEDGNLVVYNETHHALWASQTWGAIGAFYLKLQNDGSISICDISSSRQIWNNNNQSPIPSPAHSPPSPAPSAPPPKNLLWIVGVVGGVLILCILSAALIYYKCPGVIDPAEKELRLRLQNIGGKSHTLTLRKIKQATKNFERKLGKGGFGEVFYGRLADGQEVAVKVLSATSHQSKQEFFNEIELLSVVHQKYLVSLVGYCSTSKQQILIYEYMSGGDLLQRLRLGTNAPTNPLSWRERTNIILQVAEGIEYLHDKCSPAIIHRDIKTSNILLTEHLDAKVADFGLSKLQATNQEGATHITTLVKGTFGYLDPEYFETGKLTEGSDVYAFGVVLMEILTAQHGTSIRHMVSEHWKLNQVCELADPKLMGNFDRHEFSEIIKLSLWCTRKSNSDRPSMPHIVQRLLEIGLVQVPRRMVHAFDSEILHTEDYPIAFDMPLDSESSSSTYRGRLSYEVPSSR